MQETDLEIVALYPQYSRGFIYGPPPPKKKKTVFLSQVLLPVFTNLFL